ncbi:metallopeptidase family protein [bacterium]|nr:metallopeptidase family protein [bacterium]
MTEKLGRRYERFAQALKDRDELAAADEFSKMCTMARRSNLKLPGRALPNLAECWIDLFWMLGRFDLMLRSAEDAEAAFGKDVEWTFAKGEAFFYLGRFKEARQALESLTVEDFEDPMLFYLLGCLAERRDDDKAARRFFQTAHRLDAANYPVPVPVSEERAVEIYHEVLAEIPDEIKWHLRDVPIFVSAIPSEEVVHSSDPPTDPLVMGLFMGQTVGEPESSWPSDQPRILLFHKNIAKAAGDPETLEDELRKTLFHEVGHYLGFDEDQLEEMGLA